MKKDKNGYILWHDPDNIKMIREQIAACREEAASYLRLAEQAERHCPLPYPKEEEEQPKPVERVTRDMAMDAGMPDIEGTPT
jgi:hypothetical protein